MRVLENLSEQSFAKICAVYSGLVFGIYWIPLRALDSAGFSGVWAVFVFHLLSAITIAPVWLLGWKRFALNGFRFHFVCFGTGFGYVLYTSAFVYTSVVSVIVLFYMMPIWGFLLARIFIGEKITLIRWLSMLLGIGGLWVIFGQESKIPIPQNIGDWMALTAGLMWAGLSLMLLTDDDEKPLDYAAGFITWACICAWVFALLATKSGYESAPVWSVLESHLVWLIPFTIIVIVPAAIATIYGPTKLNPGIVGLLFMTEISVATITAAIWAGEPFGRPQLIGVLLVTLAGVLEPVSSLFQSHFKRKNLNPNE